MMFYLAEVSGKTFMTEDLHLMTLGLGAPVAVGLISLLYPKIIKMFIRQSQH